MGAYILQAIAPCAVIFNNEILSDYSIPNLVVLYLHHIIERTILLFHSSIPFHHSIPALHSTDSRHPLSTHQNFSLYGMGKFGRGKLVNLANCELFAKIQCVFVSLLESCIVLHVGLFVC